MTAPYTDTIRKWAIDTRRAGILENADGIGEVGLGEGEVGRRLAVRFALRLNNGRVATIRYQVFGCGFTIAACAAAADLAEGRTPVEIATISPAMIEATLEGLPPERGYCARLASGALHAAVHSALTTREPVAAALSSGEEGTPRTGTNQQLYRTLVDSPAPRGAPPEDRHLFACLLAVSAVESGSNAGTGLDEDEITDLLHLYFPAVDRPNLARLPKGNAPLDLQRLLFSFLPQNAEGWTPVPSLWLARALAARSNVPGHLWQAMGLFARPELTAAISRHLPALAAANSQGMRWKRFFFKQLCEQAGGSLCRTPVCSECSDYALCFPTTENL